MPYKGIIAFFATQTITPLTYRGIVTIITNAEVYATYPKSGFSTLVGAVNAAFKWYRYPRTTALVTISFILST